MKEKGTKAAVSMKRELTFGQSVLAGGIAGVIEIALMYPTDVVKTRVQLSTQSNLGMFSVMKNIVHKEGLGILYRGIMSPIFAEAPKRATKFAGNEQFKKLLCCQDGSLPGHRAFGAGALAGVVEAFVNCPFEMLKVRMQAIENKDVYKNELDCFRKIQKSEGILSFFRGLSAHIIRNAMWNGTYFASIGTARNLFPVQPDDSHVKTLGKKFASGLVGGVIGTTFSTPLDVVKSRMQNTSIAPGNPYNNVFVAIRHIVKTEGIRSMYKGYGPRIVRLGPGGGIMIVAFDSISNWLMSHSD
eukprot:m.58909 g.58909  ORF g.58909 m.58909 type:complete len:300 (-) comp7889_c0_seq1:1471-2370(-)